MTPRCRGRIPPSGSRSSSRSPLTMTITITNENLGTIERTEKHQRNCVYISSERRLYARTIASRIIAAHRFASRGGRTKQNTTRRKLFLPSSKANRAALLNRPIPTGWYEGRNRRRDTRHTGACQTERQSPRAVLF